MSMFHFNCGRKSPGHAISTFVTLSVLSRSFSRILFVVPLSVFILPHPRFFIWLFYRILFPSTHKEDEDTTQRADRDEGRG